MVEEGDQGDAPDRVADQSWDEETGEIVFPADRAANGGESDLGGSAMTCDRFAALRKKLGLLAAAGLAGDPNISPSPTRLVRASRTSWSR